MGVGRISRSKDAILGLIAIAVAITCVVASCVLVNPGGAPDGTRGIDVAGGRYNALPHPTCISPVRNFTPDPSISLGHPPHMRHAFEPIPGDGEPRVPSRKTENSLKFTPINNGGAKIISTAKPQRRLTHAANPNEHGSKHSPACVSNRPDQYRRRVVRRGAAGDGIAPNIFSGNSAPEHFTPVNDFRYWLQPGWQWTTDARLTRDQQRVADQNLCPAQQQHRQGYRRLLYRFKTEPVADDHSDA